MSMHAQGQVGMWARSRDRVPQPPLRRVEAAAPPRDPEAGRRAFGINVLVVAMAFGLLFQIVILFIPHLVLSKHAGVEARAMLIGAGLAIPCLVAYAALPRIIDRYDPAPAWTLLLCLAWGAFGAGGWSLMINSVVDAVASKAVSGAFGTVLTSCICAPVVEELTKGFAVFAMFYFMRRQFNGVVDGVVFGTFAALGFACFENILYYSRAATTEMLTTKEGLLLGQVIVRGVLKPWGHPLYTAITGLGFGIARETNTRWLKWLAPLGCYAVAVFLHSLWNTSVLLVGARLLPLFFLIVVAFFVLVLCLVRREGRIIRDHLRDEVWMGNLTVWELGLVTSPLARLRATFEFGGAAGRRFVDAAGRLALSKWHAGRAKQGRGRTISGEMILPLRQKLHELRAAVSVGRRWSAPRPEPMYVKRPSRREPPQEAHHGWHPRRS